MTVLEFDILDRIPLAAVRRAGNEAGFPFIEDWRCYMPTLTTPPPAPARAKKTSSTREVSDYSRFFEAGRDAAVIGDVDAEAAHGLAPATRKERAAWDAGRASISLNTLM